MRYILIALLIPYSLLSGCLSVSASSGGKAETGASASADSSQKGATSGDIGAKIKTATAIVYNNNGQVIALIPVISQVDVDNTNKTTSDNEVSASAKATAQAIAEAKAQNSANFTWIFVMLIIFGVIYLAVSILLHSKIGKVAKAIIK